MGIRVSCEKQKITRWKGFENNELKSNIVAEKQYSMLFPIPIDSNKYGNGKRLVPQVGFTYSDTNLAKSILSDEIAILQREGFMHDDYKKIKNIYRLITNENFTDIIPTMSEDQLEQEIFDKLIDQDSRAKLVEELKNLTPKSPIMVTLLNGKQYSRDNKTVAILKKLRGYRCQLCGMTIRKKNNDFYVEAAHIVPKRQRGCETPENIIILCPNHHKEFDFGDRTIIEQSKEKLVLKLNGKPYEVDLSLK